MRNHLDILEGVILGTAVGDSLGLPREGLSARRGKALFGEELRQQFLLGRGMLSDDTEHTCLVGTALVRQPHDPDRFARALAWGLRGWFAALPAGVGMATARACLKLLLGFPPSRSGVWSAGNGPAMRSALLGVCLGANPEKLRAFVRASTRITHTDPRAERGALLVALAAHHGASGLDPAQFLGKARQAVPEDPTLDGLLSRAEEFLARQAEVSEYATALGMSRGVSGYIYHTVPVVLYAWLRWPNDFRRPVEEVIRLGGDTDTTGAIVGALAGATLGARAIPPEWLRLCEWPRSRTWMQRLASRLAEAFPEHGPANVLSPPRLFWPALLPRNLFFLGIVLLHAFRRLFPPYRPRVHG